MATLRLSPSSDLIPPRFLPAVPIPGANLSTESTPSAGRANGCGPEDHAHSAWVWLATSCGLGYAPLAPGTLGAAAGVALFWLLAPLGMVLYVATALGLAALGVRAADAAESHFGRVDDGRIVIDEVVGQLVALLPLAGSSIGPESSNFWPVVTGFVAFRVFDVWKPGPVGWAERNVRGGAGVMADDLVAGMLAALVVVVAIVLSRAAGAA